MQLSQRHTGEKRLHINGVVQVGPGVLIVLLSLLLLILVMGWFVLFTPPAISQSVRLL